MLTHTHIQSQVILPPSTDDWFDNLRSDVRTLKGTNNYVPIINGHKTNDNKRAQLMFEEFDVTKKYPGCRPCPPSDPVILKRIHKFLQQWYAQIIAKRRRLKIVHGSHRALPPKLLISEAGCVKQKLHYDYNPKKVQDLIKQKNNAGVPLSVLIGFTPGGSRLTIQLQKDEPETVEIDFGEMLIFTGNVVHAGGAYTDFNIRGFLHVEHWNIPGV